MSDFGYWSWPVDLVGGYEEIRREMKDTKTDFQDKIQKVVWRGSVKTNEHRRQLIDVTNGKEWADVKGVDWANETVVAAGDVGNALSISDHCKYMFVVQTEGRHFPSFRVLDYSRLVYPPYSLYERRTQLFRPRKVPPKLRFRGSYTHTAHLA